MWTNGNNVREMFREPEKKHKNFSLKAAAILFEIQSEYLPNTYLKTNT
jgi:hypothetical protein